MPCIHCLHCRKEMKLARSADDVVRLTPRERQVVRMLCENWGTRDIAKELCISRSTVKQFLGNIYRKMSVKNVAQLVGEVLLPLNSPLRLRVALATRRLQHLTNGRRLRLVSTRSRVGPEVQNARASAAKV